MAGLGRRTFAAGEVLTGSNVMGYLQDQAVMNFAGTAARGSAIPTPSEGMVSYLADSNVVQAYDGSAWNSLAYASAVPATSTIGVRPIVPTGVAVGSGSGSYDSTTGLVTFTSSTYINVNGVFSSTYKHYRIMVYTTAATGGAAVEFKFSQSGTATTSSFWYGAGYYYGVNGSGNLSAISAASTIYCWGTGSGYNNLSTNAEITISGNRMNVIAGGFPNNAGGNTTTGLYNLADMSALDGFRLSITGGYNFTGTLKVYGWN